MNPTELPKDIDQNHTDDNCVNSSLSGGRQLRFGSVSVYEFHVVIGDNPACREGCPVQLSSQCCGSSKVDVEEYEYFRRKRVPRKALYLPVPDRAAM